MRVLFRFKAEGVTEKEAMCSAIREIYLDTYEYNYENLKDYVFRTSDENVFFILFDDMDNLDKLGLLDKSYTKEEIIGIFKNTEYIHSTPFNEKLFISEMKNYEYYKDCIMGQAASPLFKWYNEDILENITTEGAHNGRGGVTINLSNGFSIKVLLNFLDLYDVTFMKEDLELKKVSNVYLDYLYEKIDTDLYEVMI